MADFDTQRKLRLEAMQEKKKRLEELKKIRQERMAETAEVARVESKTDKEDVDNIVNAALASTAEVAKVPAAIEHETAVSPTIDTSLDFKRSQLCTSKSNLIVSVAPVTVEKVISYEKSIQTDDYEDELTNDMERMVVDDATTRSAPYSPKEKNIRKSIGSPSVAVSEQEAGIIDRQASAAVIDSALSGNNEVFNNFLDKTSKYVDRALSQNSDFDILIDYAAPVNDQSNLDLNGNKIANASVLPYWAANEDNEHLISKNNCFKNRPVLYISNDSHFKELYIVCYGSKVSDDIQSIANKSKSVVVTEESSGIIGIWSTVTPMVPEFTFHSSSSVIMLAKTNPFNHLQIIGGCYNGQILLWNMNSGKTNDILPIQRSALSGKGCHRCAICDFTVVNNSTCDAMELISLSKDGLVCHWDLQLLALMEPTKSYFITNNATISDVYFYSPDIHATAESDLDQYSSNTCLFFGNEHGHMNWTTLPLQKTSTNSNGVSTWNAHFGMVSGISLHPTIQDNSTGVMKNKYIRKSILNYLLLTISFDWKIKLWDISDISTASNENEHQSLLIEFINPSYDYICDIQWSPIHPSLFASISSNNELHIWNMLHSITEPIETIALSEYFVSKANISIAITKLRWNLHTGKQIYVGNSIGNTYCVTLRDVIATPNSNDEYKFEAFIQQNKIKNNNTQ